MVIIAILLLVLAMPLVSLFFFRVFENHLVRQSEAELIAQSIALAAIISTDLQNASQTQNGSTNQVNSLGNEIVMKPETRIQDFSKRYNAVIRIIEANSLAEVQVINSECRVVAGTRDLGLSLAHLDEISRAIKGNYASAVKQNAVKNMGLKSAVNSGNTRNYVAYPVKVTNIVVGVIYLSQRPKSVFTALYQQRYRLGLAAMIVLFATSLMGWVLIRAIANPIRNLIAWTRI